MLIHTRRDLAQHLQAQMIASRTPWGTDAEEVESSGRTQVKTYLLEAHHQDGRPVLDTLQSAAAALGSRLHATSDSDLFRIEDNGSDFWCDTSMGRFWKLHSVAQVKAGDELRDRLVRSTPLLDNVWLSPRYLEHLAERTGTQMQTFTLNHDRRDLHQPAAEGHDFESVTLRLWSSRAQETLLKLREASVFPRGLSIRSVKLRTGPTEQGEFCVAEYFSNGKVTASGTSFDEHMRVVTTVLRDYRCLVEGFEQNHGIGYVDDGHGHVHLAGDPITVDLKWSVDDLEYAVGRMFASVEPFRLWALPERMSADHYRAHAVDLHVGNTLSFDITREHIVITLPRGTCGNTVVRFLASLSYHVDSDYSAHECERLDA